MGKNTSFVSAEDTEKTPFIQKLSSPIGPLCMGASLKGIRWVKFCYPDLIEDKPNIITENAANQFTAYFDKNSKSFDLPLDFDGFSDFSIRVWKELLKIPYGETISYYQLAVRLGDPKCIRAAGTANGRNPIPIVVPCHRVIGSDGSLIGFALGLDIKKQLLTIENPKKFGIQQGKLDF